MACVLQHRGVGIDSGTLALSVEDCVGDFVVCVSGFHRCRSYGCGAVYPECVEGCSILDLGSGAGLDCFILSRMVGPEGHITGVDMTPEQVHEASNVVGMYTSR